MRQSKPAKRKFGTYPKGTSSTTPVTLANYDVMAECYGGPLGKAWGDNWPFVSRTEPSTADDGLWELYFRDHLHGFPRSYALYRDGVINNYNLPDYLPEDFDASYRARSMD